MTGALLLLASFAFAQEPGGSVKKQNPAELQVHGSGGSSKGIPLSAVIKEKKLSNYPDVTIGDVFSNYKYFSKVEWQEYQSASGKIYIDCTGQLKKKGFWNNVHNQQAVEVKFVVYPTGDFGVVMVSRIDYKNKGKIEKYPVADIKGVIDRIYANKEISF